MATRQHDTSFGDLSKQFEELNVNQKLMVKKKVISDLAGEEKESCGSNEVSIHSDNVSLSSKTAEKSYYKPTRNRLKATRQKSSTGYKEYSKVKWPLINQHFGMCINVCDEWWLYCFMIQMNRPGGVREIRCEDQQ